MEIPFKKLHADAQLPHYAHTADAGLDLCTVDQVVLEPGQRTMVETGLACAIPEGYVGLIWDKSSIGIVRGIKTLGGVVDAGYRGEIKVGLINLSSETYTFEAQDKIAQMIIQKIEQPQIIETDSLDETSRGEGGFGSTGR